MLAPSLAEDSIIWNLLVLIFWPAATCKHLSQGISSVTITTHPGTTPDSSKSRPRSHVMQKPLLGQDEHVQDSPSSAIQPQCPWRALVLRQALICSGPRFIIQRLFNLIFQRSIHSRSYLLAE